MFAKLTLVGHHEYVEYIGRTPAPPLDRFIDDIYCLTGLPRHQLLNVPPMPSAHLFINLGGPIRVYDPDPAVPSAVFTDGWFKGCADQALPRRVPNAGAGCPEVHFKP